MIGDKMALKEILCRSLWEFNICSRKVMLSLYIRKACRRLHLRTIHCQMDRPFSSRLQQTGIKLVSYESWRNEETLLVTWLYLLNVYSINYSSRKTGLPSSFLSTGQVFATRSTQSPSSLCFKWRGLLRAPNSTNSGSSPSFENSPQS